MFAEVNLKLDVEAENEQEAEEKVKAALLAEESIRLAYVNTDLLLFER